MPLPTTSGTEQSDQSSAFRMAVPEVASLNVTASSGAATANAAAVIVTSESLTTAAGAQYTLTLTGVGTGLVDQDSNAPAAKKIKVSPEVTNTVNLLFGYFRRTVCLLMDMLSS